MPAALADNDVTVYLVLDAANAGLFRSAGNSKRTGYVISFRNLPRGFRPRSEVRLPFELAADAPRPCILCSSRPRLDDEDHMKE
jgi:hypothetical protein